MLTLIKIKLGVYFALFDRDLRAPDLASVSRPASGWSCWSSSASSQSDLWSLTCRCPVVWGTAEVAVCIDSLTEGRVLTSDMPNHFCPGSISRGWTRGRSCCTRVRASCRAWCNNCRGSSRKLSSTPRRAAYLSCLPIARVGRRWTVDCSHLYPQLPRAMPRARGSNAGNEQPGLSVVSPEDNAAVVAQRWAAF